MQVFGGGGDGVCGGVMCACKIMRKSVKLFGVDVGGGAVCVCVCVCVRV